jgi:predicted nucleic acid-binding protein
MIVLDTNVISELMRDSPQQAVLTWFDTQPTSSLFVTTVTEAEILTGIALLPDGRLNPNGVTSV